jgi:hypothetical protein
MRFITLPFRRDRQIDRADDLSGSLLPDAEYNRQPAFTDRARQSGLKGCAPLVW